MNKLIWILILIVSVQLASATVTIYENTTYNPEEGGYNVTYRMNRTFEGLTVVEVNETCLTINTTTWCNSSTTYKIINISIAVAPADITAPVISNLRNTSTTSSSSFIEWDCNEACNYSILWYNSTALVNSIYNNTFALSHNPSLTNLLNSTNYLINLTVWDSSGNSAQNKTFTFNTSELIVPIVFPICRNFYVGNISSGNWIWSVNCHGDNWVGRDLNVSDDLLIGGGYGNTGATIYDNGNASFDGNITADNVWLPSYIFVHTNNTIAVATGGKWYNVTFDREVADPKQRITHTHTDGTNDTFTIVDDGDYLINYAVSFEDSAASPDGHCLARLTKNGVEIPGSLLEEDSDKQYKDFTISNGPIATLSAGDEIKLQFTADDTSVSLASHKTYGDHKDSATLRIHRIG